MTSEEHCERAPSPGHHHPPLCESSCHSPRFLSCHSVCSAGKQIIISNLSIIDSFTIIWQRWQHIAERQGSWSVVRHGKVQAIWVWITSANQVGSHLDTPRGSISYLFEPCSPQTFWRFNSAAASLQESVYRNFIRWCSLTFIRTLEMVTTFESSLYFENYWQWYAVV